MNDRQRLLGPTLEWLKAGAPHFDHNGFEVKFDMALIQQGGAFEMTDDPCESTCCMLGHAMLVHRMPEESITGQLPDCEELFFPAGDYLGVYGFDAYSQPPESVARVLEHYIETCEVDWTLAAK